MTHGETEETVLPLSRRRRRARQRRRPIAIWLFWFLALVLGYLVGTRLFG